MNSINIAYTNMNDWRKRGWKARIKILKINFITGFLNFTCIPFIITVLNMNFVIYISLYFLNN